MSKIVRAANVMVSNAEKISNVVQQRGEFFFLYDGKYKWSIIFNEDENGYRLFYYPGKISINELASMEPMQRESYKDYIFYSTKDLKTREGYETFGELYRTVKEKLFGVDEVLDDIIKDEF
jgi:hypothetical protein